jgi:hypothetical protein
MQESAQQAVDHPLKDHLVCSQQIALRWHKLDKPLSDAQWCRIQTDNNKLMEVLVSSEDVAEMEQSTDKDSAKEIKKLDAKLNLLMAWIGQIILEKQALSPAQTVSLSAKGLQFHSDDTGALSENDNLYMELFLEPHYPQAFIALATVVQIIPGIEENDVLVKFQDINEQNQSWLDKYVFQLHRRHVALARKQTGRSLLNNK